MKTLGTMKTQTIAELTQAIEILIQAHIAACYDAAHAALEKAFSAAKTTKRTTTISRAYKQEATSRKPRLKTRTSEEFDALCAKLLDAVCTSPGEKISIFVDKLGMTAGQLHRPMSQLRAENKIRAVGQRQFTRYFPFEHTT